MKWARLSETICPSPAWMRRQRDRVKELSLQQPHLMAGEQRRRPEVVRRLISRRRKFPCRRHCRHSIAASSAGSGVGEQSCSTTDAGSFGEVSRCQLLEQEAMQWLGCASRLPELLGRQHMHQVWGGMYAHSSSKLQKTRSVVPDTNQGIAAEHWPQRIVPDTNQGRERGR